MQTLRWALDPPMYHEVDLWALDHLSIQERECFVLVLHHSSLHSMKIKGFKYFELFCKN
jgi:hypothetical protein